MKTGLLYIQKSQEELAQELEKVIQENLSLKEKLARRTEECVQINWKLKERIKELHAVYRLSSVMEQKNLTLEEIFREVVAIIPKAWQYPQVTCARITLDDRQFASENFSESPWQQSCPIHCKDHKGAIDVYYLEQKPDEEEGPFLTEERLLLEVIAERLGKIIEKFKLEELHRVNKRHREKAEEELIISEEIFRKTFMTIPDATFILNRKEGRFIDLNDRFSELFGYSREETIGKTTRDLNVYQNPDDGDKLLSLLLTNGFVRNFETIVRKKDGETFSASISVWLITIKGQVCLIGVLRNIEQEKQNEIELINAKEKAEHSEIQFKAITEQAMDGINLADMDGKYVYVNQAFCNMIGYSEQELLQMSLFDLKSDEDKDTTLFQYVKTHRSGSSTRIKLICKDNSIIYADINGKKLNINGKDYVLAVLRDVSFQVNAEKERVEKERELGEARVLLKTLVDSTEDLIWAVDAKNFGFLFFNKALHDYFFKEFGKSLKIGDRPCDIVPDDRSRFWSRLYKTALLKGNYSKEVLDITKNRVVDLNFNLLIRDQEVFGISVFGKDISKQKKAGKELILAKKKIEESEQRLNLAAASAKLGIWDWNLLDNSMIWSKRMFKLYGISIDKFPNNIDAWTNGLHPLDKERAIEECNAALRGEMDFNTSFRVLHPDGKILYLKADGIIVRDNKRKPIRMIGINRDITQTKLAEQQLLVAKERAEESDRLKSAFLANLSHEIRTPMNGVLGFMELLVNQDLSEIEKKEFVEMIDKSGRRLLDTIDDIIEMSNIESNNSKINCSDVNLNELLKFHYHFFKNSMAEKGLAFNLSASLPEEKQIIHTDRKKLDRIITNLLKNALKFTPSGKVEFGGQIRQKMFVFFVKDTGIGIPEDKIHAIFDRFVQVDLNPTRHYEGSGLGLSIVKELVEMLNGNINVESELGKGSTFFVTIPCCQRS